MMDLLESVSLDGFQVVQKQFFETPNEPLVTIWEDAIGFSAAAYQALENCSTIVKKITVYGREDFEFELTNGQVAKVKTYYFHNKEDEIDSIEYEKIRRDI